MDDHEVHVGCAAPLLFDALVLMCFEYRLCKTNQSSHGVEDLGSGMLGSGGPGTGLN